MAIQVRVCRSVCGASCCNTSDSEACLGKLVVSEHAPSCLYLAGFGCLSSFMLLLRQACVVTTSTDMRIWVLECGAGLQEHDRHAFCASGAAGLLVRPRWEAPIASIDAYGRTAQSQGQLQCLH